MRNVQVPLFVVVLGCATILVLGIQLIRQITIAASYRSMYESEVELLKFREQFGGPSH